MRVRRGSSVAAALLAGALLVASVAWDDRPSDAAAGSVPMLVAAGTSSGDASSYPLGTMSFAAGHLYVVFMHLSENGSAVDKTPGLVGGGTTWTQVNATEAAAGMMGLTAYHLSPSSDLPNVALSTGALSTVHEGFWFTVLEIPSGFDAAAPIAQFRGKRLESTSSLTATLPASPAADSLVLAAFAHAAAESSMPGADWTEVPGSDLTHAAPVRGAHVIFDDVSASASPSSSWSTTARARGLAIEVRAQGGGQADGVTLAGAGDICGEPTACTNTSNRIADFAPDVVVTMGDLAYANGLLSEFRNKYGGGTTPQSRWGRPSIKSITLPGYGNHDCYDVPRTTGATKQGCDDAVAYFGPDSQFGTDILGTPGSYHTVRGEWLIVHLNSAGDVGSGDATPAEIASQNAALDDVLSADQHSCEIVIWHHPRYSSGEEHGNNAFVDPWFETAYAHGVDVVLNGHDHDYERFEPQDGNGNAVANGVREFVVGTGGIWTRPFGTIQPNSAKRIRDRGILTMALNDDGSYSWAFLDDVSAAVDDSGSDTCH